jgi:predicted RNA-binding protein (virulence factor B family)
MAGLPKRSGQVTESDLHATVVRLNQPGSFAIAYNRALCVLHATAILADYQRDTIR